MKYFITNEQTIIITDLKKLVAHFLFVNILVLILVNFVIHIVENLIEFE